MLIKRLWSIEWLFPEILYSCATRAVLAKACCFRRSKLISSDEKRFSRDSLEAYFLGRKEVFKGLAIEQLEKDWKVYPVLHLSLNAQYYENKRSLEQVFEAHFIEWEKQYGKTDKEVGYAGRFMQIIRQACEKTGEKVVVLIDEYEKMLLRSLFNDDLHDLYREMLTGFYTVLKDADCYLRFVFITGVTKFSQLGVFSNLNQLMDISMNGKPLTDDRCQLQK